MAKAFVPNVWAQGQKCMKCSAIEERVPRFLCNGCGVSLCIEGCSRGSRVFDRMSDVLEYIRDYGKHCIYTDIFGRKRIVCPITDDGSDTLHIADDF